MPLWKQLLLSLYYHATCPVRAWNHRRWASQDRLPVIVLFWHRIADDRANPWTISNAMFVRQIRWLQERFRVRFAGRGPAADSPTATTASRASASPSTTATPTTAGRPSPG